MELNSWFTPYIWGPILGWLAAQFVKFLLALRRNQTRDYSIFFKSGSMPSSHTATMVALLTVVGIIDGVGSTAFGIVGVLSGVVVYDALNVRRAVGEQGKVLGELARKAKITDHFYTAKGHVPVDVVVGVPVGVLSALTVLYLYFRFFS